MNTDFKQQREYMEAERLINEMNNDGAIQRFQGACVPASEIIQAILYARGVKARFLECTALIVNAPTNGNSIHFIGFDSFSSSTDANEVDTHVIVLVEAEIPFVIDASIGHKMGSAKFVVISPLTGTDPDIIAEASFKGARVTYRVKKNLRYFNLHQKTMIERLENERKVHLDINRLYLIVKILLAIGGFNMLANSILIVLKVLNP